MKRSQLDQIYRNAKPTHPDTHIEIAADFAKPLLERLRALDQVIGLTPDQWKRHPNIPGATLNYTEHLKARNLAAERVIEALRKHGEAVYDADAGITYTYDPVLKGIRRRLG